MNKWILQLVGLVVGVITPEIRQGTVELLDNLEERAKKTPNPWDDMFVAMLKSIMGGQ